MNLRMTWSHNKNIMNWFPGCSVSEWYYPSTKQHVKTKLCERLACVSAKPHIKVSSTGALQRVIIYQTNDIYSALEVGSEAKSSRCAYAVSFIWFGRAVSLPCLCFVICVTACYFTTQNKFILKFSSVWKTNHHECRKNDITKNRST